MTKAKKTLALVMAVIMCFTMMIGCLTISADNPGSIAVETTTIDEGTASATVNVNITGAAFAAGIITLNYNTALGTPAVASSSQYLTVNTATAGKVRLIIESGATTVANLTSGSFTLTFSNLAALAVGDYNITIDAVDFADYDENTVAFNTTNGKVTVQAVVQHTHSYVGVVTVEPTYTTTGIMTYTCSGCGDSYTETIPVLVCEHTNLTFVSATPATSSAAGSITFTCADCGQEVVVPVSYYERYVCAYAGVGYESEIQMAFSARDSHLTRQGAYDDAFIMMNKHRASGNVDTTVMNVSEATSATVSGNPCKTWVLGVPAKEMTEAIDSYVFVKYNGTWYNGAVNTKSVESYALTILSNSGVTASEKTLVANLLTYGAKAQINFNYNLDNLADANLGSYASYVTTTVPSIVNASSNPASNTEVIIHQQALDMGSKVGLYLAFRNDRYTGGKDLTDEYVKISYEGKNGTVEYVYTSDMYKLMSGRTDRYEFVFDMMAAKNLRKPLTVQIFTADNVQVSCDLTISIEDAAAKAIATGISQNETQLYYAMMNYSDAAAAFFGA